MKSLYATHNSDFLYSLTVLHAFQRDYINSNCALLKNQHPLERYKFQRDLYPLSTYAKEAAMFSSRAFCIKFFWTISAVNPSALALSTRGATKQRIARARLQSLIAGTRRATCSFHRLIWSSPELSSSPESSLQSSAQHSISEMRPENSTSLCMARLAILLWSELMLAISLTLLASAKWPGGRKVSASCSDWG